MVNENRVKICRDSIGTGHWGSVEESARQEILKAATLELRRTYVPRKDESQCNGEPIGVLVALKGNALVGTAEYVCQDARLYVQGVAVHSAYRNQGICRTLMSKAEAIAKEENLVGLALCAIEETGNVQIFEKLGFKVSIR